MRAGMDTTSMSCSSGIDTGCRTRGAPGVGVLGHRVV